MDGQQQQHAARFKSLRRFFGGLTTGQKLAAATIVVVMTGSALWLNGRGALSRLGVVAPEAASAKAAAMQPVLDQQFTPAQLIAIVETLQERAIPHETRDGKVYVPGDRRMDALSDLYMADALRGTGTEDGFDALVKQMSAWDPPSKTDKLYNRHRELAVQRVIQRFDAVRKATVIIDPTSERRMNGESVFPTAMVDIQTRGASGAAAEKGGAGSPLDAAGRRRLANAAVNVLVGSLANLSRDRVTVTVDGASYNFPGGGAGAATEALVEAGELLERRQECEKAYVGKVRDLLNYIPDLIVSVSIDLNVNTPEAEARVADADQHASAQNRAEPRTRRASGHGPEGGSQADPDAVVANAVPMIPDASRDVADADEDRDAAAPANAGGRGADATPGHVPPTGAAAQNRRAAAAGVETIRSASVSVPRSYFARVYKKASSSAAEPSDALLQPVVDAHASKIRSLVKNALGLESDDAVTVEAYDDMLYSPVPGAAPIAAASMVGPASDDGAAMPAADIGASRGSDPGGAVAAGIAATPATLLLNAHAREIALVTLGIVVLLMLSMILRRQPVVAAVPVAVTHGNPVGVAAMMPPVPVPPRDRNRARDGARDGNRAVLDGTLDDAGEVSRTSVAGDGDGEPEQDAHEMFRRVRDLVSENPGDAAKVLKEWIYQSQGHQGR